MSSPAAQGLDDLVRQVRIACTSGQASDAVELLESGQGLAVDEIDRLRLARLRSVALIRSARYVDALDAIDGVADRWLELGDACASVSVSSLEAYIFNKLGRLAESLETAARTLVVLGEIEDDLGRSIASAGGAGSPPLDAPHLLVATCRNTLGLLFLDLEALDLGIEQLSAAYARAGDDDHVLAGLVQLNLASAFLRKALRHHDGADPAEVDAEMISAERLAREVLDSDVPPRRRVEAAAILASVLHSTHRHDEATEVLEAHLHLEPLVDDYRAIADWHLLWARSFRASGRFEASRERIDRALELAQRSGDLVIISLALRERSRLHEVTGDLAAALLDLKRSEDDSRALRSARSDALVEQLLHRASVEASRLRLEREAERFGVERLQLLHATETDPLTGVGNRRRLMSSLVAVAEGPIGPVSVIMLDIDNFKRVNDERGHGFGDSVLVGVASALMSIARENDVLCRPGGDEFVLVLPGVVLDAAVVIAQRLRLGVTQLRWDDDGARIDRWAAPTSAVESETSTSLGEGSDGGPGAGVGVSISIGVASGSSVAVDDLVDLADGGLLEAKRSGRDGIAVMRSSGTDLIE